MLLWPLLAGADSVSAATYYVDTAGLGGTPSDTNPGTISQPFKTIEKARDTIRATGAKGVTVYLRGGTYRRTSPLVFDSRDSGLAGAPNVYRAYPGEQPVISGGQVITQTWSVYSGNIWSCNVGSLRFTSLYVDGVRATRARSPNAGSYYQIASFNGSSALSFNFTSGNINPSWRDLRNVEVVSFRGFEQSRERIDYITGNTVYFQAAIRRAYNGLWANTNYYVENVFEGLDSAGEWYLDNATGTLYYYTVGGKNPNTSVIEAPVTNQLISARGTSASSPLTYLYIQGLIWEDVGWSMSAAGYPGDQAAWRLHDATQSYAQTPAIDFIFTDYCRFTENTVRHTGSTALRSYSKNLQITYNEFADIGAHAIRLGVWDNQWPNDSAYYAATSYNAITDNTIHDVGIVYKEGCGIFVMISGYNTIAHNRIYNMPYSGVSVGWGWAQQPYDTPCHDNIIEWNEIYEAMREVKDGAGIYTLGKQSGTSIRYNKVHHLAPYRDAAAIYLDEGSRGMTVTKNWLYTLEYGIFLNGTAENTVSNNVIADTYWGLGRLGGGIWTGGVQEGRNVYTKNIIHNNERSPAFWDAPSAGNWSISYSDYNSYYNVPSWYQSSWNSGLAGWISAAAAAGVTVEAHSLTTYDPLFVNYSARDFRLQSSSQALKPQSQGGIGFEQITGMDTVGPRPAPTATYTLTTSATNGSVTKTPNQTSYTSGQSVSLQATPSAGYSFAGWSGDLTGTANPSTLVMNANKSVTANFTASPATYTLTISAVNGSVTKTPNQTSYAYGEVVTLQAVPNTGYTFSGWSGGVSGTANPTTITMNANQAVTASFTANPVTYSLTVSAVNGSVTKTPNQTSYTSGQSVSLQATPNTGYSFSGWSGDVTGTANPTTITMNSNKSVTAGFTANTYTLTVTAVNGSVTKTPSKTSYAYGEVVTLQAVPNTGYTFAGWSGDLSGAANPTTITMNGNKSVAAGFTANTYALTITAVNGSVTKTPSKTSYAYGEVVTLQAVPNTGYTFAGWSGDVSGTANPTTITMNSNKSVTAGFTANTYTLTVTAVNGSVTKTPSKTGYTYGEVVTLQAVPNTGYTFSGWSGDLSGAANPTTITMNGDKSVTAGFTANTYTLTVSAVNGSVTKTPNKASYTQGEVVTLEAVPNTGYTFSGWSGDATGTTNPTTITMTGNKSVTAGFTADTCTLTISAVNGSVTKTPSKTNYAYGEIVTLQAGPNTGYTFSGWSGDLSGAANPTTITMNGNKSVTAGFTSAADQLPPVVDNCSPAPDSIQAPPNTLVSLHLRDEGLGVDAASVSLHVNGHLVYVGDVNSYAGPLGVCFRSGTKEDYTYTYEPQTSYGHSREVSVTVAACDLAGNVMPEQTYHFATEMYAFGINQSASVGQTKLDQGRPATVNDGQGNLWIVWQAGSVGRRHIYAARYVPDANAYSSPVQISRSTGDHCNPAVACDAAGTLYAVWQENASGVWDVYESTLVGGSTWSAPQRVTDAPANPPTNRINPALAASRQSPGLVAVAWQDDRAGNQDIYVSRSTDGFQTLTSSRVTSHTAPQTNPALAIDGQDAIVVLWTDARNGATDIYGATSDAGPWTNVAVVNAAGDQSWPKMVAGSTGRVLHFAWVDEAAGQPDIFYARTDDLWAGPFTGVPVVDDTTGAAQRAPALTAVAGADGNDQVFVCWEDERNRLYSGTTDLYFAEVSPNAIRTNIIVDDDGTSGNQRETVLGLDRCGYPYVVWVGDKGRTLRLYYAGVTYADPVPLAKSTVSAAAGGTVGTAPTQIRTLDDVSVVIPARACLFDATIRIARIENPQGYATESLRHYDFGSSGLVFTQPVTITIPYSNTANKKIKALWFDSVTGAFSSEGVTEVRDIMVGPGLRALQFKTTHFTPFYLVPAEAASATGAGGGCSLVPSEESDPVGYSVPFVGLAAIMLALRLVDRRRHPAPRPGDHGQA